MKFSEMVYTRPDYPAVLKELEALTQKLSGAKSNAKPCSPTWKPRPPCAISAIL